ncbi:MAG TPA: TSUP family transporter [Burkholderiales bacterium]|nr:TSUP family transporter [Burkholderiales bacterium]
MLETSLLCAFAFLAGFVDAIAGGGGLIQVPALFAFFPSAPPAILLGTNKLVAVTGTTLATLRYLWSVPVSWKQVVPAMTISGVAAMGGAKTVMLLNPGAARPILLVLLIAMVAYALVRPALGQSDGSTEKLPSALLYLTAALFGFYDGFFGPGAGSVLMFVLARFFGYGFLRAAATTKLLNLSSNFCSLLLFLATGNVLYLVALPMAACNVVGGFTGAHLAVRLGNRFIRWIFMIVCLALIAKLVADLYRGG